MADSLDDIIAALDAQALRGGGQTFGTPEKFVSGPGFGERAFNFGLGGLFAGLENIDQLFGNPVRNLIGGDLGGAAESVVRGMLPGSWVAENFGLDFLDLEKAVFGDKEYDPFTGTELLEKAGVGNVENLFLGIDSRDIGGLGVDILTDPLNLVGGMIGKGVAKGAAALGRPLLLFTEGLAGSRGLVNTTTQAFQRGKRLADFVSVPQANFGIHASGAVIGASFGGASAVQVDESVAGGAFFGALGGLAGGAALAHAPALARGALGGADLFSKQFALGRRLGFDEAESLLDKAQLTKADRANRMQAAVARHDKTLEVLEEQVRATGQNVDSITGQEALNGLLAEMREFSELQGAPEFLAARAGGTKGTTFGAGIAPQSVDDLRIGGSIITVDEFAEGLDALPGVKARIAKMKDLTKAEADELAAQAENILKSGGIDALAEANARFDAMPQSVQELIEQYHLGDVHNPLMPGRIDVTKDMVDRGILDQNLLTHTLGRTGVAFLPHMRSANTVEHSLAELLNDLKEVGGIKLNGPVGFVDALREARSAVSELSSAGQQGLKRRELLGTIEKINKQFGSEFLEESFAKLGIEDVRRWSSLTSTDDLLKFTARDVSEGGFVRSLPAMVKAAEDGVEGAEEALQGIVRGLVDGDQVFVQSADIPLPIQKIFKTNAPDPRVADDIARIMDELPVDPVSAGATLDPKTSRLITNTDEFLDVDADPLFGGLPRETGLEGAKQAQFAAGLDAARKARIAGLRRDLKALVRGGDTVDVPVVMDKHLFDDLFGKNGAVKRIIDPKAPHKVLKIWQDMNRMWTGWTLGPFASWMNRNAVGNIWNNYLSGVGVKHSKTYWKAGEIQDDVRKFFTGRADEITGSITVGKKTWKKADLVQELIEDGVIQGGFAYTTAGEEALKAMSIQDLWKRGKQTLKGGKLQAAKDVFARDPQQNFFSRTGFSINAVLEDIPRITHYMAKQSDGLDRLGARQSVLKALGNFRDLSAGDEALKTVMPFWAWTRFNVPRQVRGLVEGLGGDIRQGIKGIKAGPVPVVAHLKLSLDDKFKAEIPEQIIPEYLQGQLALPMGMNSDGKFEFWSLNRWLPLADITEIDSPKKMLQFLTNSLSPFLSEPIEQGFNFDTFYKEVIQKYPGEQEHILGYPLNKRSAHLIRNLRVITEFDTWVSKIAGVMPTKDRLGQELAWYHRLMNDPTDVAFDAARQFTGLKGRVVDLKRAKKFRLYDLQRTVGDLKRKVRKARKANDQANESNYRRLLLSAKQQLKLARRFRPERNPHFRALELDR